MQLFEDPFDILAILAATGLLAEIKTLDGTVEDERERVREALAQLLYYEAFVTPPAGGAITLKLACFERPITVEHQAWLNRSGIVTIWEVAVGRFEGDVSAPGVLRNYVEEFR